MSRYTGIIQNGLRPAVAVAVVVAGLLAATPGPATAASAARAGGPTADCDALTACYTPQQVQVAYDVTPLLGRAIDGRGQTVVLPEAGEAALSPPAVSDLRQDMADFDRLFRLPAARLRVVTALGGNSSTWAADGEEVLDAEMVHAIAPRAAIVIALLPPTTLYSTANAVASATASLLLGSRLGGVISASEGGQVGGERCVTRAQASQVAAVLRTVASRHVTVVAASGDTGAAAEFCSLAPGATYTPAKGVALISSDPYVLAAGGSTLIASHATGAWESETGWGLPYGDPGSEFQASSGGFSSLFARPAYQDGAPGSGSARGVPDVAADANPHFGMALVVSDGAGKYTIRNSGGTSAAAPLWAGLIALADQYAGRHLGFVNPAIYRIARSPAYHRAFHDITSGNNTAQFPPVTITGYDAGPGWDPVTGWGAPDAAHLIPLLARS
jgi:subtilase family serine protease